VLADQRGAAVKAAREVELHIVEAGREAAEASASIEAAVSATAPMASKPDAGRTGASSTDAAPVTAAAAESSDVTDVAPGESAKRSRGWAKAGAPTRQATATRPAEAVLDATETSTPAAPDRRGRSRQAQPAAEAPVEPEIAAASAVPEPTLVEPDLTEAKRHGRKPRQADAAGERGAAVPSLLDAMRSIGGDGAKPKAGARGKAAAAPTIPAASSGAD
jgi:hypothetical protein